MTLTMNLPPTSPGLDLGELLKLTEQRHERVVVPLLLALAAHAALALMPWGPAAASDPAPRVVEIELPPPSPPAPPEPQRAPPPEPEVAPESATSLRPVAAAAQAPPAAAAGAVLTANDTSENSDPAQPFDFTSDPNSSFGVGVVAVGGNARRGLAGARASGRGKQPTRTRAPAARAPAAGDGLTKAADLSQAPRLRANDPCKGYFPTGATVDLATAVVRVVVGKSGAASSVAIISESPRGQGFGSAARTCMARQRFAPAIDRSGQPAATAVAVNVRFSR